MPKAELEQIQIGNEMGPQSRTQEILLYIMGGYTYKQTADELGIGFSTVHTLLDRLKEQYGFHENAQLVAEFIARKQLIDPREIIRIVMPVGYDYVERVNTLSPQEQRVLHAIAYSGKQDEDIGTDLTLSYSTVRGDSFTGRSKLGNGQDGLAINRVLASVIMLAAIRDGIELKFSFSRREQLKPVAV